MKAGHSECGIHPGAKTVKACAHVAESVLLHQRGGLRLSKLAFHFDSAGEDIRQVFHLCDLCAQENLESLKADEQKRYSSVVNLSRDVCRVCFEALFPENSEKELPNQSLQRNASTMSSSTIKSPVRHG